jgi:tripartite-type tricarboxylate transporter receptor subunit TctC
VLGRIVAEKLSAELAQQVVVDNRAAASGVVGTEIVANAAPDGYTLLQGSSSTLAVNTITFSKLPYDPLKSFASVSLVGLLPWLMVTKPAHPRSVPEFVSYAKSRPGKLLYAGSSSAAELATQWFSNANGITMVLVPYRGTADAMKDFMAGQLDLMINPIATAYPLVRSGRARALAVTTENRSSLAPEIPTVAEQGVTGFDVAVWHCLMLPAGTSPSIIGRLNRATAKILLAADVRERFAHQGAEVKSSTPAELGDYIRVELARWRKVATDAGIKPTN